MRLNERLRQAGWFLERARGRGVRGNVAEVRRRLLRGLDVAHVAAFDRWYGLDTEGFIASPDVPVSTESDGARNGYQATTIALFERMVNLTTPNAERYTFVDIGCGKGRAMILAAVWGLDGS
jgi:hypothetical protein